MISAPFFADGFPAKNSEQTPSPHYIEFLLLMYPYIVFKVRDIFLIIVKTRRCHFFLVRRVIKVLNPLLRRVLSMFLRAKVQALRNTALIHSLESAQAPSQATGLTRFDNNT